jgi:hypothetical protein
MVDEMTTTTAARGRQGGGRNKAKGKGGREIGRKTAGSE